MQRRPLPPDVLRKVAVLYVQQVLWGTGADHYRTLGVQQGASREQIAEHLRWLTKWVHPDRQHLPQEAAFSGRVINAWNVLKTPDRRQEYDQSLTIKSAAPRSRGGQNRSLRRLPWIDERGGRGASNFHWTMWRVV